MQWWLKLHRKLLEWEWYDDINTKTVFIHLLLTVNYEDKDRHWQKILSGQKITSYSKLAKQCKLSVKQIRLCINKLKRTSEIDRKGQGTHSLVTILRRSLYQSKDEERANEGQATGQSEGKRRATTKEYKEIKNKEIYMCDKKIDEFVDIRNKQEKYKLPKVRKITEKMSKQRLAVCKEYEWDEVLKWLENYCREIHYRKEWSTNDSKRYFKHRFSLREFFKREWWLQKFINK